ncbi:hypothetical protein [Clostridium sp.]|uniref:hypothetical protein n=1 Tax=Clostridium sp. TaxID=1506 RepID=UPI0025C1FFFB|nr:hypothetical protein [Clostridium sp.]
MSFSLVANATVLVPQENIINEIEGQFISITPLTNLDELPNIDVNSDVYNDLKLSQENMPMTISVGQLVHSKATNIGTDTLRVSTQNIGIDTLDFARITVRIYKNNQLSMITSREEPNILPMFWRNNDFYCAGYTSA